MYILKAHVPWVQKKHLTDKPTTIYLRGFMMMMVQPAGITKEQTRCKVLKCSLIVGVIYNLVQEDVHMYTLLSLRHFLKHSTGARACGALSLICKISPLCHTRARPDAYFRRPWV